MNNKPGCPICESTALLHFDKKTMTFRKENFSYFEAFYKCNSCGEEFTTSEVDEVNTRQVYNLYRERHNIPSPEQLTYLKNLYRLNSTTFSKLLGFGTNQFSNYEKGEVPNDSNATLLNICKNPQDILKIIHMKKQSLPQKMVAEAEKKINEIVHNTSSLNQELRYKLFDPMEPPDRFNGFKTPSFEKFYQLVLFFLENAPFKTRLNKLLFYADFTFYKYFGNSITGLKYSAIQNGPVPKNYELGLGLLENINIICSKTVQNEYGEFDKIFPVEKTDTAIFSKNELDIMSHVLEHFRYKKTGEIISISHNEEGWTKNHDSKALISYSDFAPLLKEF